MITPRFERGDRVRVNDLVVTVVEVLPRRRYTVRFVSGAEMVVAEMFMEPADDG